MDLVSYQGLHQARCAASSDFTASTAALVNVPGYAAYSHTKAALRCLSDSLRQEVLMYHACVDIKVHCSFPGTIYTESFYKEQDNKPRLCKEIEGTLDDRGGMSMWLRAYSPGLSRVMFTSPQTSRRACCSTIFAAPVHETLLFLIGCSDCPCLSCGLPSAEAWIEASTNTSHNSNSCILCCERYFSYSYVARIVRKSTCYHPDRLRHACMSCGTAILTAKLSFERSL
jgi:hypothetical protein